MKSQSKRKPGSGGKRNGSGRKPLLDPKKAVTFYIPSSIIDSYANIHEFRAFFTKLFTPKQK